MLLIWCLAAFSGIMPPVSACISAELATTFERIFVPFSTTAAAVSSQLVSIPNIFITINNENTWKEKPPNKM
jgi:hypothetical protein